MRIHFLNQYVSQKSLLLAGMEAILICAAFVAGVELRFWNQPDALAYYLMLPDIAFQIMAVAICIQSCFYYNDLYEHHPEWDASEQISRICQALGAACLILSLLYFAVPPLQLGRGVFFIALTLAAGSVIAARITLDHAWRKSMPAERVAILGTGELALDLAREIGRRSDLKLEVSGFVRGAAAPSSTETRLFGRPILGNAEDLTRLVEADSIDRIIVALEDLRGNLPVETLLHLRASGTRVEDAHSAIAALTGRVRLDTVRPSWFIFSDGFRRTRVSIFLKRTIDLVFGITGMILSLPIIIGATVAIWFESRGPILYRQRRVGLKGKLFEVLKFRTMREDAEAETGPVWASENDTRVTRLGGPLRKYRIDELPQFFNVIRGDMSFVGPRPERPEFVDELRTVILYYDERHTVRPGITGWAQVKYPYGASVEDACKKLEYDLFYLKNMSAIFDLAIVARTVKIVLFGKGSR